MVAASSAKSVDSLPVRNFGSNIDASLVAQSDKQIHATGSVRGNSTAESAGYDKYER